MNRILVIDRDRTLGASMAMTCLERGVAIRMAETFCEGVRYMMEVPVSAVLVDTAALRLAGADRARLFETVAPGVPVIVTVPAGTPVEEHVPLELQGFRVLAKPFVPEDVLDKIDGTGEPKAARRDAAARLREVCG